MSMKFRDFAGVAATLIRLGFIDENGNPTERFHAAAASAEARRLDEGYFEVFGEDYGLEFVRDLMLEFVEQKNADALRVLVSFAYDRSGTGQPAFFLLLDEDARVVAFADALADALDEVLDDD